MAIISLSEQQIVDQLNLALQDSVVLDYRYLLEEQPVGSGFWFAVLLAGGVAPIAQIALDATTSVRLLKGFTLDELMTRENNTKVLALDKAIEARFIGA